jgi:hypothetical protein
MVWAARHPPEPRAPDDFSRLRRTMTLEPSLAPELREPDWTDGVRLTGAADATLWRPDAGGWQVLIFSSEPLMPETERIVAGLYQLALAGETGRGRSGGAGTREGLTLVRFGPEPQARLVTESELADTRAGLLHRLGQAAEVLPGDTETVEVFTPEVLDMGRRVSEAFLAAGGVVRLAGDPVVAPRFIRYPVELGPGVRPPQLQKTAREVGHRLGLHQPPLVGLRAGRVWVDVERPEPEIVRFRKIQNQLPKTDPRTGSPYVPVGVAPDGRLTFLDLTDPLHAHVLVAGAKTAGKTEWLRQAAAGLMARNTPDTLALILFPPGSAAWNDLETTPFAAAGRRFLPSKATAVDLLEAMVQEMDHRLERMAAAGVLNREDWIRKTGSAEPRLVLLWDDYSLRGERPGTGRIFEGLIQRLGTRARLAGLHLIIAVQPSGRETVSGVIQAHMPCRVALRVENAVESTMLIRQRGAENLSGHGDMLFRDIGEPVRLQAAWWEPPAETPSARFPGSDRPASEPQDPVPAEDPS